LTRIYAAREAAEKFFQEKLGGRDQFSCGFAWTDIFGIKGNTRLGKAFKAAGIRKSYTGSYQIWNPSEMAVQNIDTLEAGAEAAARVFEKVWLPCLCWLEVRLMVLEQALEIMRLYAVDQDQDDLTAVEHMVRNMKLLNPEQLEALDVFMANTQNG
jgi:hypothetical protein